MNILEEIILYKKIEVDERKKEWSIAQLEESEWFGLPTHSLKDRLIKGNTTGIIAEFKRRSPSKGLINETASVEEVTRAYTEHGAAGLSILTDEKFFGGFVPDLLKARKNDIPILRKDFIIDEYQLIASKSFGADQVLLIAAVLGPARTGELAKTARNLGLEVILEIHDESELECLADEVDMIGVNNRDLKTFSVDINTSIELIGKLPPGKPAITESGIHDTATLQKLRSAGYKGFLMGEKFMKESDPGKTFAEFVSQLHD